MNWGRCVCNRHHRNHAGCHKALWYTTWRSFKLWLDENCHHHNMGVKPQALNLTKLFLKSGDNLTTLWETVVVSNENVQEPTKMLGESNSLWYYKSQFQHVVDIIMEMVEMLRHFTKTEKRQLDSPPRLPCWYVSMVHHRKTNTLYSIRNCLSGRHDTAQESTLMSANVVQFNVATQLDNRCNLMDCVRRYITFSNVLTGHFTQMHNPCKLLSQSHKQIANLASLWTLWKVTEKPSSLSPPRPVHTTV